MAKRSLQMGIMGGSRQSSGGTLGSRVTERTQENLSQRPTITTRISIAERKLAEAALRESELRIPQLAKTAGEVFLGLHAYAKMFYVSPAVASEA